MIVKYLNTNRPAVLVLLPVFNVIAWIPFILNYSTVEPAVDSWFCFMFKSSLLASDFNGLILGISFSLFNAILANLLFINSDLSGKPFYLFAFIHVLIEALLRNDGYFYTWQLAECLLMGAFYPLLRIQNQRQVIDFTFLSGFLCGIAAVFYLPSVLFFPIIFFFLQRLRPFIWREWFFAFIGSGLLILFYITYKRIQEEPVYLMFFNLPFDYYQNYQQHIYQYLVLLSITLFAVLAYLSLSLRSVMFVRKQRLLLLFYFVIIACGITLFNLTKVVSTSYQLATFTLSLFIGLYLVNIKRKWFAELVFTLLMAAQLFRITI